MTDQPSEKPARSLKALSVGIAGGGIAGMAAAIAFARYGHEVTVYERAPELSEVGAGVQMSPNAMRALDWLGAGGRVRDTAFTPEAVELRHYRTGRLVYSLALGAVAEHRYGKPYLQIHRADLHEALIATARDVGVNIVLDAAVTKLEQDGKGTEASLLLAGGRAVSHDLVVGADGVRSAVRKTINPRYEPIFSGNVCFRGTVRTDSLPAGMIPPVAGVWMGPKRHFVHYYLRGGELVNFIAVAERKQWTEEGWSHQADLTRLRREFSLWHPTVREILDVCRDSFEWGLFDHPPVSKFNQGRAALIGDAAHPVVPFLAQGAALALEDAVMMARAVEKHGVEAGLASYSAVRRPRAARIQAAAKKTGSRFHSNSSLERLIKGVALETFTKVAPSQAAALNDWIYSYDCTSAPV